MSPSSVCHPQTNGQVELVNKNILESLKKRLDDTKGLWIEELLSTFWAIKTTTHSGTRDTSFNLAFGSDIDIPVEIEINSLRVAHFDPKQNKCMKCATLEKILLLEIAFKQLCKNVHMVINK